MSFRCWLPLICALSLTQWVMADELVEKPDVQLIRAVKVTTNDGKEFIGTYNEATESMTTFVPHRAVFNLKRSDIDTIVPHVLKVEPPKKLADDEQDRRASDQPEQAPAEPEPGERLIRAVKVTTNDGKEFIGTYNEATESMTTLVPLKAVFNLKRSDIDTIVPHVLKVEPPKKLTDEEREARKQWAALAQERATEDETSRLERLLVARTLEYDRAVDEESRLVDRHNQIVEEFNSASNAIASLERQIDVAKIVGRSSGHIRKRINGLEADNSMRDRKVRSLRNELDRVRIRASRLEGDIESVKAKLAQVP